MTGPTGHAAHPGHFVEVCRDHGTVLAQCRCPGPKSKQAVACPGSPPCPPPPGMRVRAVIHDDRIFVCLGDLVGYVEAAAHQVDEPCRRLIASLLGRLGEALESDG